MLGVGLPPYDGRHHSDARTHSLASGVTTGLAGAPCRPPSSPWVLQLVQPGGVPLWLPLDSVAGVQCCDARTIASVRWSDNDRVCPQARNSLKKPRAYGVERQGIILAWPSHRCSLMQTALPIWDRRTPPVFDVAQYVWVVEVRPCGMRLQRRRPLLQTDPVARAQTPVDGEGGGADLSGRLAGAGTFAGERGRGGDLRRAG